MEVAIGTDTAGSGPRPRRAPPRLSIRLLAHRCGRGHSGGDPPSGGPDPFSRPTGSPRPFRTRPTIEVPAEWPAQLSMSDRMAAWFERACHRLARLDVELRRVDIAPMLDVGSMLYDSIDGRKTHGCGWSCDRRPLPDAAPPKPGLIRLSTRTGGPIEVEIWSMSVEAFGLHEVDGHCVDRDMVVRAHRPLGVITLRSTAHQP